MGEGDARTIDAGPPAGAAVGTASTVLGGVTPAEPGPRLTRGAVLGRYFIIEPLGAGGMGVVYTAYDPELDRKVAIKLMHRIDGADDASARLLREAKLMAKIAHPNVITVHDVGTIDGRVFVAMELVEGPTLRAWLRTPRRWREALAVLLAAARGLAAAHDAGLVHRDFKPENVLVGADGRVRVLDFGLARPAGAADAPGHVREDMSGGTDDERLTPRGAVAGTPAYMSPEQYDGRDLDARSDQFSLCVTLWEALHGEHPFAADNVWALAHAIGTGQVRPPPRDSRVPKRIARVLLRGMAVRPEDRHPSVQALVAALERDPWRRVRRALPWASAAAALAAAAGGAALYFEPGVVEVRALREGQSVAPTRVQVGEVMLEVGPDGARGAVPAGTYRVVVEAAGFHLDESVVEVQRGGLHQIARELRREQGRFSLDVEPSGGTVLVDGVDHGSRLRGLQVDTGPHALVVRKEGHHDAAWTWTATSGGEVAGFVSLAPALRWSERVASGLSEVTPLGDVDGDGAPDLLLRNFNVLRVIDPWTDRTLWSHDLGRRGAAAVEVVDVDGDGARELFARWLADDGTHVALWDVGRAGGLATRWARVLRTVDAGDANSRIEVFARDLDGDGVADLTVSGREEAGVSAYSGRDGRTLWTARLPEPRLALASVPLGPAAFVGVTAARRFGLDGRTGAVLWDMSVPSGRSYAANAVPVPDAAGDGVLLTSFVGDDVVQCRHRAADGAEVWCAPGTGDRVGVDPRARPSVEGDDAGASVLIRVGAEFHMVDAASGAIRWRRRADEAYSLIAGSPPLYALRSGEEVIVGAALDGRERFRARLSGRLTSAPVRHDWDGDGRAEVVFAAGSHELVALDEKTGARVGAATVPGPVIGMWQAGDVDLDGLLDLSIRTRGGEAIVGGPKAVWSRRAEAAIRATPALADLDGDGDLELAVFGSFAARTGLHVFDGATGVRVAEPPDGMQAPDVIRGAALVPGVEGGLDVVVGVGSHPGVLRYRGRDAAVLARVPAGESPGYAAPARVVVDGEAALATAPWSASEALLLDPATLAVRRAIEVPAGSWNAPVSVDIAGGTALIFALHDQTLRAFAAADGRELWQVALEGMPIAGPTVGRVGGRVVALASRYGRAQELVAFDPQDGAELWSVPGLASLRGRPVVADLDGDGSAEIVVATDRRGLVTLDERRAIRWEYAPRRLGPQPEANTSPVVDDLDGDGRPEVLATFRDGALHVVDGSSGAPLWRFRMREERIDAEPVVGDVDGDGVKEVVLAGYDQHLYMLRAPRRPR